MLQSNLNPVITEIMDWQPVEVQRERDLSKAAMRTINYCSRYNVLYVTNQKAGCSTIKLALQRLERDDPAYVPDQIHKDSTLSGFPELGWGKAADLLKGSALVFSFVRHPVARAASTYGAKIKFGKEGRPFVQHVLGQPLDRKRCPSIDEFVEALEVQPQERMNPHWRPQHINLMCEIVQHRFVGTLENFDTDWRKLRVLADFPEIPIDIPNARGDGKGVFDGRPDLVARVEQVYAKDFEIFGY